jgi:myosin-1
LGLLENVRVRRAGFAFRQDYSRFLLRYKMLATKTWPNFRGSDMDGTKIILQEYNLAKDVTYGKTKLFVQSPESLFQLEEARDKCLPKLVIFLQKIWKGVQARRLFKKMKAALKIGLYYRHCVRRGYIRQICSAYK